MKAYIMAIITLITTISARAQVKPIDDKSSIDFTIRNLGFGVNGSLKGIEGTIHFDPAHPDQASFDISVEATTVNTDNTMRDDHLRGESYLDVKHYPKIHFISTGVKATNKANTWIMSGKLTIKNHTQALSFPFTATANTTGGYIFKGSFQIKRKDFEVGGTSTISDEMGIILNVLAN